MTLAVPVHDRRMRPRVDCVVPDSKGQIIRNLSQGGLFVESSQNYALHDKIPLSFSLFTSMPSLKVFGEIVWRGPNGNQMGYGLRLRNIGAEEFKQIQYFVQSQMAKKPEKEEQPKQGTSVFYKTLTFETEQENLARWDSRLAEFLRPSDFFSVYDLTKELRAFVDVNRVRDGLLTAQILHTSATLCINELDEPMLLMDIARKLRAFVPKEGDYLHNSSLRQVNLCADDSHCDRNGDAHVKSSLFGQTSVSLIIRDGRLVLGQWQKVALIEFDGPRKREVLVQVFSL